MLKKHAERNSHASRVTVIVKETEPSLLSFVAIFFQTAPVFFFFFSFPPIIEMDILTLFTVCSFTEIMGCGACSEG